MNLPEKELELIEEATQRLSSSIVRIAILRLTLLGIIVFAFANAFRQIGEKDIAEKINDIDKLESLTNVSAWNLGAYAVQDFALLRGWLTNPRADESRVPVERAREVLSKYLQKEPGPNNKTPDREAKTPVSEEPSVKQKIQDPRAEPNDGENTLEPPTDEEILRLSDRKIRQAEDKERQAAAELQNRLAEEVKKAQVEVFSPEYSIAGAKLKTDLRNWFALLPFLLITSELYLYILRKQRKLLRLLASSLIHSNTATLSSIPTLHKLLFADRPGAVAAYERYPSRLSETIYFVLSLSFLIYLALIAEPIWKGLAWVHYIVLSMPLLTAVFYAVACAFYVSTKLEMQFTSEAALTVSAGKLITLWQRIRERGRRIAAREIPRFWLTTGSGLILLTLYLGVGVDSCGGVKRGRELLFNPVQVTYVGKDESIPDLTEKEDVTWWSTALLSYVRSYDPDNPSRTTFNLVVLNQHLGRGTYILSLMLAALTIALWLSSYSRLSLLKTRWLSSLLYFVSGGTLLFFVTDLYLAFYPTKLKFVLMLACWLTPLTLWASLGFSQKKQATWANVRPIVLIVIAPLAVLSVLIPTITLFDDKETLSGLLVLLLGVFTLCLGYRQLTNATGKEKRPQELSPAAFVKSWLSR